MVEYISASGRPLTFSNNEDLREIVLENYHASVGEIASELYISHSFHFGTYLGLETLRSSTHDKTAFFFKNSIGSSAFKWLLLTNLYIDQ